MSLLQIEINLVRRKLNIYGFFNIVLILLIIFSMLFGIRFLIDFVPDPYLIRNLIATSMVLLGGVQIHPDNKKNHEMRMYTFFPSLKKEIYNYFNYKRMFIVNLIILFLFMPSSFTLLEIKIFFYFATTLQVVMLINTLSYKYLPLKYAETINALLRVGYFAIMSGATSGNDLWGHLQHLNVIVFITISTVIFISNALIIKRPKLNGVLDYEKN